MTDDEFLGLDPPLALAMVNHARDEAERIRLRLLYAHNRGMLVDGSGSGAAPTYRPAPGSANAAPASPAVTVQFNAIASRTFGFMTKRGLPGVIISLVVIGGSEAGLRWLSDRILAGVPEEPAHGWVYLATIAAMAVCADSGQAFVSGWAALLTGDRRVSAGAWARFVPVSPFLVAGALAQWIGVTLATLALVIPGAMLMTAWAVWAPALVVERLPLSQAFTRSAELTRGSRWTIFALLLVAWIGYWVIVSVMGPVVSGGASFVVRSSMPLWRYVIQPIADGLMRTLFACGTAALYAELVTLKQGAATGQIAEIFG